MNPKYLNQALTTQKTLLSLCENVVALLVVVVQVTKSILQFDGVRPLSAICSSLALLWIRHLVQVIIDSIKTGSVRAVHVEPPVANTCVLVEDRPIGTEEAELLPVGQTPMPDLERMVCLIVHLNEIYGTVKNASKGGNNL